MSMSKEAKEMIAYVSLILPIMLIFAFALFKTAGIMVVLAILIISLPFYFILNRFSLAEGEKVLFSILMGATIPPSMAYLFGLFTSFRIAIAISLAILAVMAFLLNRLKPKN